LDHPQTEQNERGGHTDVLKGRDQPDRAGAQSHAAERNEKRVLATNPIAHPTEQECPQGTYQESGGEQRDRAQQSRGRAGLVKELDRQDRSQAPENVEIIPLNDIPDRRRDNHASEILGYLNCHCFLLFALKGQAALGRAMLSRLKTLREFPLRRGATST